MKATRLQRTKTDDKDSMLREVFVGGLRENLKTAVSYITDDADLEFDNLVLGVKQREALPIFFSITMDGSTDASDTDTLFHPAQSKNNINISLYWGVNIS